MQIKEEKKSYSFNNLNKLQGKKYSNYNLATCVRGSQRLILSVFWNSLKYSGYVWNVKIGRLLAIFIPKKKKTKESFWWMTQFIMWFLTTD